MDEAIKKMLVEMGASRSVASDLFTQEREKREAMYANMPSASGFLNAMFSAASTIEAMYEEIIVWRDNPPEGKHLVVTMRTPDGRIMDVYELTNKGAQAFIAKGKVKDMSCMTMGHISSLSLFFSYEENYKGGKDPMGFHVSTTKTPIEPQTESERITPDTAEQNL